jgi:6-pyruvoyltetrahydropterin/6-carboxytetrahydropterin synthase
MEDSTQYISITRKLTFETGHRVMGHEGKCANPHGHSYKLFVHARAPKLDGVGRVIDFSVLKEKIGGWIDAYWDHGFILYAGDYDMRAALYAVRGVSSTAKFFSLPSNPTAENMAHFLLHNVCPSVLKDTGVEVFRITLWETENCSAEVSL